MIDVYNSVLHTGTGMSPNEALDPSKWGILKIKQNEERIRKYKQYAKPKIHRKFQEGDEVLVQEDIVADKQAPKYITGAKVIKILGNDTYEVFINGRAIKRYASQIRGT